MPGSGPARKTVRAGLCYASPVENAKYWEYIPGLESSDAYAAFEDYRDQDPKQRTLISASRRSGVPYPTVLKWSRENFWIDRVASYDIARAQVRAQERERIEAQEATAWAEQRAEILAKLREVSLQGLDQLAHDLANRRTRLRPNELKQITDLLLKFGNIENGDPTEIVDNQIDLSQATPEQLAALESLRELGKSEDE